MAVSVFSSLQGPASGSSFRGFRALSRSLCPRREAVMLCRDLPEQGLEVRWSLVSLGTKE